MKKAISCLLLCCLILNCITLFPISAEGKKPSAPSNNASVTNDKDKEDTSEQQPTDLKLTVVAPQTVTMGEGGRVEISVDIGNNSNIGIKRLTAQAQIDNPDKAYIDGNGIIFENNNDLRSNTGVHGRFFIRTDRDFTSKTVPVNINLRYYIAKTNEFREQQEKIYIRVTAPKKPVNPAIEITKLDDVWPKNIVAGQEFQIPFQVKNTGDALAKNIKISLEGLEDGKVTLASGLSTQDITNLAPGQSSYLLYNLSSDRKIPGGNYMLKLNYTFVGEEETQSPKEGSYQFSVAIKKAEESPSLVEFKNISSPTGTLLRNQTAAISFDLQNNGNYTAKNLKVTATSQDQAGLASKSVSQINCKELAPGQKQHFNFQFMTTPGAETKNYPVELKVTYSDENTTDTPQENSQIVGVFVKAPIPKDPNAKGTENSSVPKLIIAEYSFDPQIIEAGKPFHMYLKLYNTNAKKAVKNIKIFLTSDMQESATGSSDSQTQNSSSSSSSSSNASVFTPVGSSNTFFIDSIGPGKQVDKEIVLTTVPDTAAKTYTVIANFEYEDAKANKYTATEQIGVPVVQQAKLEVGEIVPQSEFSAGAETPLSVDFYNTGKATLYNVMIKISGDDLKFDTPTYYKGNFAPGASDQFSCNVTPNSSGDKKLTLTFTFEDSTGKTQTITRDHSFTVADNTVPSADTVPDENNTSSGIGKKILSGLLGLLVLILGFFGIKKIHNRRKEKDEDLKL